VVELAHPLPPELGRTRGAAAASTGLGGGRGKVLPASFLCLGRFEGSEACPRNVRGSALDETNSGGAGGRAPASSCKRWKGQSQSAVIVILHFCPRNNTGR
jgi:hypothetical protein